MTKADLLADLKNKLSPIKNYLAMQREYESLSSKKDGNFMDGYKKGGLISKIADEKIKAEAAMSKVELIIELLEKTD